MKEPTITWTEPMLSRFRLAYQEAKETSRLEFTFEGHDFLTSYAKYLIQYLDSRFYPDRQP